MNNLQYLQARIKYSRLYKNEEKGFERLYFRLKKNTSKTKYHTWFEIVNDSIRPGVIVDCSEQHKNWEINKAEEIRKQIYKQFHELINNCELERQKTPLHERLQDDITPIHENSMLHQAQALRFCCSMKVSALFADTGTGKSKIAIDLCNSRFEAGQIKKALIFCPVSTKRNFNDEIEKWSTNKAIEWKIIGLESMSQSDKAYIEALGFVDNQTQIIIDESHQVKTPFAKRSKRIKECCDKCSYKIIMTGTPAENVRDLYMQYAMLSEHIIREKSWLSFEDKYLILGGYSGDEVIGHKNVDYLMGLLEPYTYQITKEDVLDLPDKHFKTIESYLTDDQYNWYYKFKDELLEKLENLRDANIDPSSSLIFKYFTKLQQVACGYAVNEEGVIIHLGNGKFKKLEDTNYQDGQTIFFCKYIYEVHRLVEYLGAENCAVFTGENRKERDAEKEAFTKGKKQFFVATMSSGGTGLNGLQQCNRIVFFSNSFMYRQRKQCISRIDRKGQTKQMKIFDMRSNCQMERRITANLCRKKNMSDEIKELLKDKTKLKQYVESL